MRASLQHSSLKCFGVGLREYFCATLASDSPPGAAAGSGIDAGGGDTHDVARRDSVRAHVRGGACAGVHDERAVPAHALGVFGVECSFIIARSNWPSISAGTMSSARVIASSIAAWCSRPGGCSTKSATS